MKTLNQGNKKNWWVGTKVTCKWCRAELELEEADKFKSYQSHSGVHAYFSCPECGVEIRLNCDNVDPQ